MRRGDIHFTIRYGRRCQRCVILYIIVEVQAVSGKYDETCLQFVMMDLGRWRLELVHTLEKETGHA